MPQLNGLRCNCADAVESGYRFFREAFHPEGLCSPELEHGAVNQWVKYIQRLDPQVQVRENLRDERVLEIGSSDCSALRAESTVEKGLLGPTVVRRKSAALKSQTVSYASANPPIDLTKLLLMAYWPAKNAKPSMRSPM